MDESDIQKTFMNPTDKMDESDINKMDESDIDKMDESDIDKMDESDIQIRWMNQTYR